MKYRRLGSTELKVSVIGLGTWQLGGEWGKDFSLDEVCDLFAHAKGLGINLVDTAECYGDHLSESLIGQAIRGQRDAWILATKFGHHYHGHLHRSEHWSVADVLQQLEESLIALRTDYIDLYQFHSGGDAFFDQDDLWTMLDKQVCAGKIRFLGNSIGDTRSDYQVMRSRDVGVSVIQVAYNLLDRGFEDSISEQAKAMDLGVLVREPLANGLLSGKYQLGTVFVDENDWRSSAWTEETLKSRLIEVDRLRRDDRTDRDSMVERALSWVLNNHAVSSVIPGCKSIEQLEVSAAAGVQSFDTP